MTGDDRYAELVVHLNELAGDKELEKRARSFANNPLLTEPTRQLISDLWKAYSDARWVNELMWERINDDRE